MDIIFRVSGQTIARLDNNEIAAGSANFLRARFELSSDWLSDATPLVFKAVFEKDGAAYHVLLDDDLTCDVAPEVLEERGYFYVGLIGLSPENTEEIVRITTIRENVYVSDGSSVAAANNFAVSQDEIEQAVAKLAALGLKLSVIHSVNDMEGLCLIESVNYWFCWLGADETKYGDAVLLPGGVYSITSVDGGYVLTEDDSLRGPRGFTGDKGEPGEALKVVRSSDELKTWCEGLASNVNFAYCLAGEYFEFSFELGSATLSGDMDEGDVWRFSRVDYSFDFCYSIIGEEGYTPRKGVDYFDGKSAYEYAQDGGYTGTEEEFAAKLAEESVVKDVRTMQSQIADLMYKKIDITSFTNTVNTAEIGSTVDAVTLNWGVNKTPAELTLDGASMPTSSTTFPITGAGIRSNKTWTLTAKDERGATDTATTSISFLRGVYYGVYTQGGALDNDFILSLTRKLQSGKAITFTANAAQGEQIAFALPQSYGTPSFNVGGFDGGFHLEKTFEFTNASGHAETYCIWLSDNAGLGNTTVKVN